MNKNIITVNKLSGWEPVNIFFRKQNLSRLNFHHDYVLADRLDMLKDAQSLLSMHEVDGEILINSNTYKKHNLNMNIENME